MRRDLTGLFAAAVLLAALAMPASAQWRDTIRVLRVGILAGANQGYALAQAEPFRAYLADRLSVEVEIVPAVDYATLMSGQMAGGIQAAFLSATAYAAASAACAACIEPLAVPTTPDGLAGYHAVLVTIPGSPIRGPGDLVGRRLAVSAPDSVAGRVLPLRLFAESGIDVARIALVERASPEAAVAALLAGEADAALAWSSLRGDRASGYASGVFTRLVAAGGFDMNQVAVAWQSPLIPFGPFTVQAVLPAELKAELAEAMLGLAAADAPAFAAIDRGWGGGFVAATAEMYAPFALLVTPIAAPN